MMNWNAFDEASEHIVPRQCAVGGFVAALPEEGQAALNAALANPAKSIGGILRGLDAIGVDQPFSGEAWRRHRNNLCACRRARS